MTGEQGHSNEERSNSVKTIFAKFSILIGDKSNLASFKTYLQMCKSQLSLGRFADVEIFDVTATENDVFVDFVPGR